MSTLYKVYMHMLEKQEQRRKERKVFGDSHSKFVLAYFKKRYLQIFRQLPARRNDP
jgi:hypothetical protein